MLIVNSASISDLCLVLCQIDEVFFLLSPGVSLKACFSVLHAGFKMLCFTVMDLFAPPGLIDYDIMESK